MLSAYILLVLIFQTINCYIPYYSHNILKRADRETYKSTVTYCNLDLDDDATRWQSCQYTLSTFHQFDGNELIHPNFHYYHNSFPARPSSFVGYKYSHISSEFPVTFDTKSTTSYSPIQLGFEHHCTAVYTVTFWENLFTYWMPRNCPRERGCASRFLMNGPSKTFDSKYFICTPVIYTSPHVLTSYELDLSIAHYPDGPDSLFYKYIMSYPLSSDTFLILCDFNDKCAVTTQYCLNSRFKYDSTNKLISPSSINMVNTGEVVTITQDDFSDCVTQMSFSRSDFMDHIPIRFIPGNMTVFSTQNMTNTTLRLNSTHVLHSSPIRCQLVYSPTKSIKYTVPVHSLYSGGPSAFIAVFSALSDELLNLALKILELYIPYIVELLNVLIERIYITITLAVTVLNYVKIPFIFFDLLPMALLGTTININNRAMIIYIAFSAILITLFPI